ncbi:type II secretion system minor pseudopilin GspK [Phaeobacter sp. J2-8]|uniref:type II secretion system minor pseudopilin GspK n=1 Tax=Phaeobacter sp. J2-8 TaxID=2931394 RepID=UPI001FD22457|nr:type II secretion system minor pseudopilin GspK [Phaeobacter sp. J2-8]MCJ7874787.1 type II secretion system minor pseudopilin GspK [Phaeobacter sp. J2-8]
MKLLWKMSETDKGSRGFVLVNALLLVAAMAAAATLLLSRAEGGRVRLVSMQEADALTHAMNAFEAMARTLLDRDQGEGPVDSAHDIWAGTTLDVPLARGRVSGVITDQQALFNINWLSDPDDTLAHEGWPVLLHRIGIAPQKGDAIRRFVSPGGPENSTAFSRLDPPVAPLGGGVVLMDQLAALAELTPEDMGVLRQYASALPANSRVNVNTAGLAVLTAMIPQLSKAQLNTLVQRRDKDPFASIDDVFEEFGLSVDPATPDAINPQRFSVGSNWFGANITVTLDARQANRRVLFRREGAPIGTQVEWRLSRFK